MLIRHLGATSEREQLVRGPGLSGGTGGRGSEHEVPRGCPRGPWGAEKGRGRSDGPPAYGGPLTSDCPAESPGCHRRPGVHGPAPPGAHPAPRPAAAAGSQRRQPRACDAQGRQGGQQLGPGGVGRGHPVPPPFPKHPPLVPTPAAPGTAGRASPHVCPGRSRPTGPSRPGLQAGPPCCPAAPPCGQLPFLHGLTHM